METPKNYENFPFWIVLLSSLSPMAIYVLGCLILLKVSWMLTAVYLLFVLYLEFKLIRKHCVNCYYWGKTCGFGKGRVSAWLFKKGEAAKFCENKMTWKDMIPDLLVSLVPVGVGIYLLIADFDWLMLIAILLILLLTTSGNGFIRGQLTCKYCRQRELGCPAEKLFDKEKS
jgi:hypothetical protein